MNNKHITALGLLALAQETDRWATDEIPWVNQEVKDAVVVVGKVALANAEELLK